MIKRVAVLVEGQTEDTFVKEILADHLSRYHIFPYATRVCTKRVSNCVLHFIDQQDKASGELLRKFINLR